MPPEAIFNLKRWTSLCAIALIAATFPLWTPQTVFPQVPVLEALCHAPGWLDWISLAALLTGLILVAFSSVTTLIKTGYALVLLSLPVLVCLDQHRFQPWAYQLFLFVAIWWFGDVRYQVAWLRSLIVSVYLFSAIGKFDYEFLHSVGQQMLGAMFKLFGQNAANLQDWFRLALVAMFPLFELLIAIGLVWPRTRRFAGLCAIGLHATLIIILGPLGLNHRPGVLLWNTQFAVQAYLLFVKASPPPGKDTNEDIEQVVAPKRKRLFLSGANACCVLLISTAICMPLTERFGVWDHWPSWALYAPHSSRVRVEVTSPSLSRLPASLVALCRKPTAESEEDSEWIVIPIEAWSLQSLATPIYPQARFQIGVAKQIATKINSENQVRIYVLGHANRFTGLRENEPVEGTSEIERSGGKYWLNTRPRTK